MNFDIKEFIEEINALLDYVPIIDTNLWIPNVKPLPLPTFIPIQSIIESPNC